MANMGDVIIKINPVKSPIESIVYDEKNKLMVVGHVATEKDTATLSTIDIISGKTIDIIEKSDKTNNSIWKLVIDNTCNFYIYLKQIYEGENRYNLIIYDTKSKEKKIIMSVENNDKYYGFNVTSENKLAVGYENTIEFWNIEKKSMIEKIKIEKKFDIDDDHSYMTIASTSNNKQIAIGGIAEGKIFIMDTSTKKIIDTISIDFSFPKNIIFCNKDKLLAIADYWQKGFYIWDTENKSFFQNDTYNDEMELISCFCINNEKGLLGLGMKTSYVKIMDITKGKTLFKDKIHSGRITNVLFTPDGKKLISAGEDGHIIVRSIE